MEVFLLCEKNIHFHSRISFLDFPWQSKNYVPESAFCAMMDQNIHPQWYPVHELSFIVFFLIPVIILTFLYISMVKVFRQAGKSKIRKSTYRGGEKRDPPKDNRKQIIRMLGKYLEWIFMDLKQLFLFSVCGCSFLCLLGSFPLPASWLCLLQTLVILQNCRPVSLLPLRMLLLPLLHPQPCPLQPHEHQVQKCFQNRCVLHPSGKSQRSPAPPQHLHH